MSGHFGRAIVLIASVSMAAIPLSAEGAATTFEGEWFSLSGQVEAHSITRMTDVSY